MVRYYVENLLDFITAYQKFAEIDQEHGDAICRAYEFTTVNGSTKQQIVDQTQHERAEKALVELMAQQQYIQTTFGIHPQDLRYAGSIVRNIAMRTGKSPLDYRKQMQLYDMIRNDLKIQLEIENDKEAQ